MTLGVLTIFIPKTTFLKTLNSSGVIADRLTSYIKITRNCPAVLAQPMPNVVCKNIEKFSVVLKFRWRDNYMYIEMVV